MAKFFSLIILISLVLGCKRQQEGGEIRVISDQQLAVDSLPKRVAMNSKVMAILKDWPEFKTLESSFDALYKAQNREELILIMEDFVEKQKIMAASEYPQEFDIPQIKSRQKVLKTFILKTKAALEYRTDLMEPTTEMIVAYNALRRQFNVTVNNTLDTDLILVD
ncbi:MAG: hypothetical protein AB3N14_21360 [Flavobacteriaceae bacterium]